MDEDYIDHVYKTLKEILSRFKSLEKRVSEIELRKVYDLEGDMHRLENEIRDIKGELTSLRY